MKYAAEAAAALGMVTSAGATAVFTRKAVTSFNPVTQQESTATSTFSMPAVAIPPGRSAEARLGSLEGRNLLELHLAPNGRTAPAVGDSVRWAGNDWSVIWVNVLDPAGDGAPYALAYVER